MPEQLTIAYSYGASSASAQSAKDAFTANVDRPFRWAVIDWRDEGCLDAPSTANMNLLKDHFGPPREDPALEVPSRSAIQGDGADLVAVDGVVRFAAHPTGSVTKPEDTLVLKEAGLDAAFIGPGDIWNGAKFLVNMRKGLRKGFVAGVTEVGTTVADILNYMRSRDAITSCVVDLVKRAVESAPGQVVLVGESLGGIMLVDALASMKARNGPDDRAILSKVGLLFTFASQSAALELIRPGGSKMSPGPFTPWANVWNPDDYLSYPVEPTYENTPGVVRDHQARHRSLFPAVHTEYVHNADSKLFAFLNWEIKQARL